MGLLVLFAIAAISMLTILIVGILWQMNRPRRKTLAVSLGMGGPGDPADLELTGQEVTFNLSDRSTSAGWIIDGDVKDQPPDERGRLPAVAVVVHGHRDSRFGGLYRAQMLRPYVAATVLFDLPGHGDAEANSCQMGVREVDDVAAVIAGLPPEVLEEGGRPRPIILLGYSMGAVIAVRAAARWDALRQRWPALPRLSGLIACAPYRYWDEGLRGQMVRRRLPTWPTVSLVGGLLRLAGGRWGQPPGLDLARDAAAVDVPTLVLHGDADAVCPLSAGRAVAEAAPHGELTVISGGTHNQLLGADYEAVHTALARFFARLGPDV